MIAEQDYAFLKVLLKERSGLALTEGKEYLLEGRLGPVARSLGFGSIAELVAHLRRSPSSDMALSLVVDAMTTNETLFFRDHHPFEAFRTAMLPHLVASRPADQPIRIWSTAASAGQEPYSIAMIVKENAALLGGRTVDILASDISTEMLARAEEGLYTDFEVKRGLDTARLRRFFTREGQYWRLAEEIRGMVRFQRINLLDPFDHVGTVDVVFCRNVLIYFDARTKLDVVERIAQRLRPDGFLVLGGAETLVGMTDAFRPSEDHRAIFRPAAASRRRAVGRPAAPARDAHAQARRSQAPPR